MKTAKYLAAMLLALIIGFNYMNGQTASRSETRTNGKQTTVKNTHTRQTTSQKARPEQVARQVQKQQVTRQRTTQPARQVKKQQVTRQRTTQPARQVKEQQVTRQRTTQPARQVKKQQVTRQRTTQPATTVRKQQVTRQRTTQPATTVQRQQVAHRTDRSAAGAPYNKISEKRHAETKVRVKPNKYSEKHYYSGHHYHHVYPARRVKVHHHHDTYLHNYHVLYYPVYRDIYWTRNMYRDYHRWYPNYRWRYDYGYRINTISVFDAKYNLGEVAMVYGRVSSTWYNRDTDDYLIFFGGEYPYQEFTVVLPGHVARKFSWRPEKYFLGEHLTVTGLITTIDGIPEIIVKNKRQLGIY